MAAITIRDVPDEVRDELAARAARSGRSLQEYLRLHLIEVAERPTMEEVVRRITERVGRTGTQVTARQILDDLHADRR